MDFPRVVTFYPMLGIEAARKSSRVGGAWRLWVLAKALDGQGLGMVRRKALRAFALSLGMNPRTYERWVNEARGAGFMVDIQKGAEWWFILPGPGTIAVIMGAEYVGSHKAIMSATELIGKGWKARVFSAWETGKQISRERIQKTINVPVRTQRYRDAQAGTQRESNYSRTKMRADKLPGIREHSHYGAPFVTHDGHIAIRLPDTRQSVQAERGRKGRARKVNRFIRRQQDQKALSSTRQGLADVLADRWEWVRLFNRTPKERKATERKLARLDGHRVTDIFQRFRRARSGAVMWKHYPILAG